MMAFVRQGSRKLRRWAVDPAIHTLLRGTLYFFAGFGLSAASLGNRYLPLGMGLTAACTGSGGILACLGAVCGYGFYWQGFQGIFWCAFGLLFSALLSEKTVCRETPLLLPMATAMAVALGGVLFQSLGYDDAPVFIYLLRVLLAGASTALFTRVLRERNPLLDWLACGLGVLALAQIVPLPYLGLGYVACGALLVRGAFPAVALAGLAIDLAGITPLPMTAILCLSYLVRFLPRCPPWLGGTVAVTAGAGVMYIGGIWDIYPLPGLFLGAIFGTYLPIQAPVTHRRGETGLAQVRLELASGVLAQAEQLLSEQAIRPVDEAALVAKAAENACGSCPCRKNCKDVRRIAQLPSLLLHKPLVHTEELPIICKKSGRFLAELHRSQEQLRSILADRERQKEYRDAVLQQYHFVSTYLQELSDTLTRRGVPVQERYGAQVQVYTNCPQAGNGDVCLRFMGTGGRYYIILCDGMGTGPEAAQEAKTGGDLLRRLLSAGFPAAHALGSLNSICALRDRAGALTVDMAEVDLATGRVCLYKWGGAASYLLWDGKTEKIGTPTPPPGLAVPQWEQPVQKVTLRRGERLIMVSDGVSEEIALRCCEEYGSAEEEILAQKLLDWGKTQGEDDATVVCLRLKEQAP